MKKFRLFLDLNTEEDWINGVQAGGYRLDWVNPFLHCYTFQPLTSADQFNPYTRLDFRDKGLSRRDYQNYRQLFSDSGWRLIAGSRHGGIQYFQQRNADSGDEIFSDERSKARCRRRFSRYSLTCGLFLVLFVFILPQISHDSDFFNPQSWYLTPNLWQMQGSAFWQAFLFETPWVLLRVLPPLIFLIVGIYFLCRVVRNGYHQD